MTVHNVSVGVVGKDEPFHLLDSNALDGFIRDTAEGMEINWFESNDIQLKIVEI